MDINPENTSTALGGVLGSIIGITWLIKKGLTAWKTESLEAARVDSLSEVVNILTGQIKDLNQTVDELRRTNKELREINDNLSEDNRQLKREIGRLRESLDELKLLIPSSDWDGTTERRNRQ